MSNNSIASWETGMPSSQRSPLFSVSMSPLFMCRFFILSLKGGASWSRVSAVGAAEALRTAGSPAPAVLQPDAMSVGLDAEADRCHLNGTRITWRDTDGAAGQREGSVWNTGQNPGKSSVCDLNYDDIKMSSLKYRESRVNIIRRSSCLYSVTFMI